MHRGARGSGRPLHPSFRAGSGGLPHVELPTHREDAMTVAELMQRNIRTVLGEATVAEAIVALADGHISGMPVVDGSGRVIGVVSTTDVITAEAENDDPTARQALLENTVVRDIMTPRPFTVGPGEDVREAARQMLYADVHRLFVAEGDKVIGIISTTDIVRAVATGLL